MLPNEEAYILNRIGQVYSSLGNAKLALDYLNQALSVWRIAQDIAGEAATLHNIGYIYYCLGEPQKALDYNNKALSLRRAIGSKSGVSASLNNIGLVYDFLEDKQKALDYYNQSLNSDPNGGARTLTNIGGIYNELGEAQKALGYLNNALKIQRTSEDFEGEPFTINNIGIAYFLLGEKQKALDNFNQAIVIWRTRNNRRGEAYTLNRLMLLWNTYHQPSLAIFYGKLSVNLYQSLRADIQALDKELQKSFLKSHESTYRDLTELLIAEGRLAEAQQVLGLLKEEELFEFVRRDNNEATGLQTHADYNSTETKSAAHNNELIDQIAKISADYGTLLVKQSRTPDEEKQLRALSDKLEVAKGAFQKFQDEELPKELANSKGGDSTLARVKESQALQESLRELGPGTIAIYTIVEEQKYRIILVTPDLQKTAEYTISAADLNKKVFAFREVLQTPALDPLPLAQELYKIIVGPITKDLQDLKAETLMWSLDGTLRYLPIAALHDGQHYLVDQYRNTVFTPASNDRIKDTPQSQWKGLGLGFSKPNDKAQQDGFNPLPGVAQELHTIIKEEGQASGVIPGTIKLDSAFTAEAMKTLLRQRYPVVHIASHFHFKPGNEKDSFLLLGNGEHLDISQIKLLSFGGVDLLTLSACNTAMGTDGDGKEVEGFGVLAQRQGAKAVLASLWSVSDESTALLMQEFYRLRSANPQMPKAELLRQAQQALLQGKIGKTAGEQRRAEMVETNDQKVGTSNQPQFKPDAKAPFAHPYYWAPFILIGNWK